MQVAVWKKLLVLVYSKVHENNHAITCFRYHKLYWFSAQLVLICDYVLIIHSSTITQVIIIIFSFWLVKVCVTFNSCSTSGRWMCAQARKWSPNWSKNDPRGLFLELRESGAFVFTVRCCKVSFSLALLGSDVSISCISSGRSIFMTRT